MRIRHVFARPPRVGVQEAMGLLEQGAVVVDVRAEREWRRHRIPGSLHLPLVALEHRALELPDDRLLLTFCTGGLLSSGAATLLAELGFEAASMAGGLVAWRAAGGPLATGSG